MKTLADGRQYPHTGQIYSTGAIQPAPIAQPPPIPELDYNKFADNYISTKKRPLAIADKERPLLIKDVDRSKAIIPKTPTKKLKEIEPLPIKSASKKATIESYGKRIRKKIKSNAVILSEEYLGNPKNIKIKELKELMMSYGATEDQIKKFTREKQREKAVKVFLKTIQPESDGEPVRTDTIYKSPIKGLKPSQESPMKSPIKLSKSPIKKQESDTEAIKSDTIKLFSPTKKKKEDEDEIATWVDISFGDAKKWKAFKSKWIRAEKIEEIL
jgi:hypothetical protein